MKLFHPKSTSPISPMFMVQPGEVAVISAFGFEALQRGVIQKVRLQDEAVPSGSSCGDVLTVPDAKVLAVEDVTQCGVWAVNACANTVVLAVPGLYRIVLDDGYAVGEAEEGVPVEVAESTAVGTVLIEVTKMTVAHAALLPKDLFFGHISQCSGCN